jgi:2'-5' RNA ligase
LSSSRYFFALWPPAETALALESWAKPLEGRITSKAKIHLTLAFLGDADPENASAAARGVSASPHAIPMEAAKYWKHNRIVWAGPRETPRSLKALVEALHPALERAGYPLERRPFAAHVTLARDAPPPRELPPLPTVEWPVREFTLVRSKSSPKGPAYEVVERFPL